MAPSEVLAPGATVGILGGGQLGRMLALAAARLGLKSHVFAPEGDNPAMDVATRSTCAAYDDREALSRFAEAVHVVTTEFENVPAQTLTWLAEQVPVAPAASAVAVAQDRVHEKTFLQDAGVATAPFMAVHDAADLPAAVEAIGLPAVLKTRRFGYDGKGQQRLDDALDVARVGEDWPGVPCILEGFVAFACEVSVIAARGRGDAVECFEVARNRHRDHILHSSRVPAGIDADAATAARAAAVRIIEALDYVGVLGVEFFVLTDGRVLVNEIAPRVHNSGHWTQDACSVDQFEQHVRAICGWPLGVPQRHADVVMENLLGDAVLEWFERAAEPGCVLHLYGKAVVRPGRKMGHVNRLYALGTLRDD